MRRRATSRLQALEHCRRGENAEAGLKLQLLSCTYRLSPQGFQSLESLRCSLDAAPALVHDQVLSGISISLNSCDCSRPVTTTDLHRHSAQDVCGQGPC